MATNLKNLSEPGLHPVPSAEGMKFGVVVSEWNSEVTEALAEGCIKTLTGNGAKSSDIRKVYVPGSFELTLGAQFYCESQEVDAVICLGCVIQGETRHFDFICEAVANGITNVGIKYNLPVIFGVLTTNNPDQAKERSGGRHGNKGDEAAVTAIKMVSLKKVLSKEEEY